MCAHALAKGDKVVATLRRPEDLDSLANAHASDALLATKLDVTNPAEVVDAFRVAKERFGCVDVVLNNAGCTVIGEVEGIPDEDARRVMEVNFWGGMAVSREAVRFFREDNPPEAGGLLLTVSSDSAHCTYPGMPYYNASKHALEAITEALVWEVDPKWNIKICLITPGGFRTELTSKAKSAPIPPAYSELELPKKIREYIKNMFDERRLMRLGDVDKAAAAIYEVSTLEHPPLRVFLGADGVQRIKEHYKKVVADMDASQKWAESAHCNVTSLSML